MIMERYVIMRALMKMERRVIVSRQNNKQQIEEKKPGYLYLPLALAVAVVPLIAVAKRYNTGLTKYACFPMP